MHRTAGGFIKVFTLLRSLSLLFLVIVFLCHCFLSLFTYFLTVPFFNLNLYFHYCSLFIFIFSFFFLIFFLFVYLFPPSFLFSLFFLHFVAILQEAARVELELLHADRRHGGLKVPLRLM